MLTKNGPKNEGEYREIINKLLNEAMADKFSDKDIRAVYHKFNSRSIEAMKDNTWNNKLYKRLLQDEHYAYKDVVPKKYEEKDAYDIEDIKKYIAMLMADKELMAVPPKYYMFNIWEEASMTALYFSNKKLKGEIKGTISSNDPFIKRKMLFEFISFIDFTIADCNKEFPGCKIHKSMQMRRKTKLKKITNYFYNGFLMNDSVISEKVSSAELSDRETDWVIGLFNAKVRQQKTEERRSELRKLYIKSLVDTISDSKEKQKKKEAEDLEKLMDIYDLDEDERELVRSGEYDPEQFDEENPEEGDYYYEEWKEEQEWLGNKVDD